MISKAQLQAAPKDPATLNELEERFSDCATSLIDSLLNAPQLKVKEIDFRCVLNGGTTGIGGLAAEAQIINPGNYRILIGRNLSNAILNFSQWSSRRISNKLDITNNITELQSFLYDYWMWFTLHHELAHVLCGHLDLLAEHGLARYAEIYSEDEKTSQLNIPTLDTKDVWWAIESEADSIGTASSLASLNLTNHGHILSRQSANQTIAMHGLLTSLYFFMFNTLKSSGDERHPPPAFRKAICQPSLDKLCKQLGLNYQDATEQMIMSDFDNVSSVLEQQIDLRPYFEAFKWMWGLDDILQKMELKKYRKQ